MRNNENIQRISRLAMLTALSIVLVALIQFPIFPAAPYLKYDPADIPILISAFMYGPWYGVAVTVVVSLIQAFAMAGDGIIGAAMHILAAGVFCLVAGYIYKARRTRMGAVIGLVCGTLARAAVMAGWNLVLTPLYTGMTAAEILPMLLPVIIPFNLIVGSINSAVTFLTYKPVERLFALGKKKTAEERA